jgi:RNA polymerase sigma factor (sigma-70 family)
LAAEPGGRSPELEVSDLVHGLLDQLRPDHRRLIELRYLHNADIDEIAAQVASSTEDVEVRLAEALEHLRHQARHVYDA